VVFYPLCRHSSPLLKTSRLLGLVSIKAFIGLIRTFSVLTLTGYSYNMITS